MKHLTLILLFCTATVYMAGCTPKPEKAEELQQQQDIAADNLDAAKTEMKQADQAMEDYTYARKAEFVTQMKADLDAIEAELNRLSDKVDRTSGATRTEAKAQLDAVRKQWTAAKQQLDEAEKSDESNWDETKRLYRKTVGDMNDSFAKTRQWLSDKIEP